MIGILSVPLALCFDTDSYFYGMLPVRIAIGTSFGVEAFPIAVAIKNHIRASFGYVWVFSILYMIFAVIMGVMPL